MKKYIFCSAIVLSASIFSSAMAHSGGDSTLTMPISNPTGVVIAVKATDDSDHIKSISYDSYCVYDADNKVYKIGLGATCTVTIVTDGAQDPKSHQKMNLYKYQNSSYTKFGVIRPEMAHDHNSGSDKYKWNVGVQEGSSHLSKDTSGAVWGGNGDDAPDATITVTYKS